MVYRKSNFLFVLHMKILKNYPQWWDTLAKLKKFLHPEYPNGPKLQIHEIWTIPLSYSLCSFTQQESQTLSLQMLQFFFLWPTKHQKSAARRARRRRVDSIDDYIDWMSNYQCQMNAQIMDSYRLIQKCFATLQCPTRWNLWNRGCTGKFRDEIITAFASNRGNNPAFLTGTPCPLFLLPCWTLQCKSAKEQSILNVNG